MGVGFIGSRTMSTFILKSTGRKDRHQPT